MKGWDGGVVTFRHEVFVKSKVFREIQFDVGRVEFLKHPVPSVTEYTSERRLITISTSILCTECQGSSKTKLHEL